MGADLCGYFCYMLDDSKLNKQIMKKHLDTIQNALDNWGAGKNKGEFDTDQGALEDLLSSCGLVLDLFPEDDLDACIASLKEDIEIVKSRFPSNLFARDLACNTVKFGGKKIIVCFAGEMSWGDEPEGAGYQLLRAISRTGLGDKFYDAIDQEKGDAQI